MKDVSVSMEEAHWGGGNDPTLFISSPVFAGEFPAERERERLRAFCEEIGVAGGDFQQRFNKRKFD